MEWQNILNNKTQTFLWSDKVPQREIIEKIINELHTHCPSKQNNVPYSIEVLDWSNKAKRNQIFKESWCDTEDSTDRRNPQVLAPYLIVFYARDVGNPEDNSYTQLEIGLASMFITMSAVNYGLNTGFCGCNHNDEILMILGVGYADSDPKKGTYWNPISQQTCNFEENTDSKPNKHDYIKFD